LHVPLPSVAIQEKPSTETKRLKRIGFDAIGSEKAIRLGFA